VPDSRLWSGAGFDLASRTYCKDWIPVFSGMMVNGNS